MLIILLSKRADHSLLLEEVPKREETRKKRGYIARTIGLSSVMGSPGYQRQKSFRVSSLMTRVRICNSRCALF
jgi:hypothetical protein